jgi:chromosome segregation protein
MPMHDQNGEFQGAIVILDDISDTEEIHAELRRKQQDLKKLDGKYREIHTQFELLNRERNATDNGIKKIKDEVDKRNKKMRNIESDLEKGQKTLETTNELIASKTSELNALTEELREKNSMLSLIEFELQRKQKELEIDGKITEMPDQPLKGRLTLSSEIDQHLDTTDGELRTKKIEDADEL